MGKGMEGLNDRLGNGEGIKVRRPRSMSKGNSDRAFGAWCEKLQAQIYP